MYWGFGSFLSIKRAAEGLLEPSVLGLLPARRACDLTSLQPRVNPAIRAPTTPFH